MLDFLHIGFFVFLVWSTGQGPLAVLRRQRYQALALPLGLSIMALAANLMYFGLGASLPSCRIALLSLALAGLLARGLKRGRPNWRELGLIYLLLAFLALPAAIGGQQYYVFRGGTSDHLNYIEMALAAYEHPYSYYLNLPLNQVIGAPILLNGAYWFQARPIVAVLFATVLSPGSGDLHLKAFLYNTALWAMVYPAARLLWLALARSEGQSGARGGRVAQILFRLVPLSVTLGFYSQIIFDMNAWSHLAAGPIFLGLTVVYADLLEKLKHSPRPEAGPLALGSLLAGGAFLLYPEGALAFALFYLGGALIWLFFSRPRPGPARLAWLILIPAAALLLSSLPYWRGTVEFIINSQIENSLAAGNHEGFLTNFWLGAATPPSPLLTLINLPASWAGLFFLTPQYGLVQGLLLWLWIAGAAVLSLGLTLNLFSAITFQMKNSQGLSLLLRGMVWAALPPILFYLSRNQFWTAAKVLTYLSPVFITLLSRSFWPKPLSPQGFPANAPRALIKGAALMVMAGGLCLGLARPWSALDPDGLGYASRNYPHPPISEFKKTYRWEMRADELTACQGVKFEANLLDYVRYMEQKLLYYRIPYDTELSLFFYYFRLGDGYIFRPAIFSDCYLGQYWDGRRVRLKREPNHPPPPRPPFKELNLADPSLLMKDLHLRIHPLELRNFKALRQPALTGFYLPNDDGRWLIGPKAVIQIPQGIAEDKFELILEIKRYNELAASAPVRVTIGGQEKSFSLDGAGDYSLIFQPREIPAYEITIEAPQVPGYIRGDTSTYEAALSFYLTRLSLKPL